MSKNNRQAGTSLVELAIVLAIIGLLLASILGGTHLVKAASLRRVITEMENIRSAIEVFEETYTYLPGDIANAESFWGASATDNGDGDGYIEFSETTGNTPIEDLLAWEHLALAELVPGSFTGAAASAGARYELDTNVPVSEGFSDGAFMVHTENDSGGDIIYGTRGTTIRFGTIVDGTGASGVGEPPYSTGDQYPYGGVMVAKDAQSIDNKLDDGIAYTGSLYSIRGTGGSGCVDDTWRAATADYDLDDTNRGCSLVFWYSKM